MFFQNDVIHDALYMDLKWYLLPAKYQREVCFMIKRMQNGIVFTIGPFQTLNYETLKTVSGHTIHNLHSFINIFLYFPIFFQQSQLTQRIHSFLMLLLNFGG